MLPLICFLWWKKNKVQIKSFKTGETRSMCWNYQDLNLLFPVSKECTLPFKPISCIHYEYIGIETFSLSRLLERIDLKDGSSVTWLRASEGVVALCREVHLQP